VDNIRGGFRGSGIWPVDIERALDRVVIPEEAPGEKSPPHTPQQQLTTPREAPYTPKGKLRFDQYNQMRHSPYCDTHLPPALIE
jgi:hypothetical protein